MEKIENVFLVGTGGNVETPISKPLWNGTSRRFYLVKLGRLFPLCS